MRTSVMANALVLYDINQNSLSDVLSSAVIAIFACSLVVAQVRWSEGVNGRKKLRGRRSVQPPPRLVEASRWNMVPFLICLLPPQYSYSALSSAVQGTDENTVLICLPRSARANRTVLGKWPDDTPQVRVTCFPTLDRPSLQACLHSLFSSMLDLAPGLQTHRSGPREVRTV
jgi:ABC-type Fe3+ transport system permease subunit